MELPIALTIGLLFAAAVYSLLRPNLLRMVIGFSLLSNAVNVLMIACGGFTLSNDAPFVRDPQMVVGLMDPLPPDIILTAIVISFAVGALFLTVAYAVYREYRTIDPDAFPVSEDAEGTP
jgi:multicomponent Na+:H+ antiporter subunit C